MVVMVWDKRDGTAREEVDTVVMVWDKRGGTARERADTDGMVGDSCETGKKTARTRERNNK
jgi:hypothetical protein